MFIAEVGSVARVEVLIDHFGQAAAETPDLHEIVDARTQYPLQTSEMLQEFASLHGPQTRYRLEDRLAMTFCPFASMSRDRKAVCFVAHALNQVQST